MRNILLLVLLVSYLGAFLFFAPVMAWSAKKTEKPSLGRQIENFSLRDFRGKVHSLDDFQDSQLVVVAFVGTECPLAKLYTPRLVSLAEEFQSRGVTFLAIDANSQDNLTEIAAYARTHEIPFPVLKDNGNKIADLLGAVRTPEVFVLDQKRKIRYWGRIDDQYEIGIQRTEPKRRDLAIALEELLAGKKVSQPKTDAIGCFIGRKREVEPHGDVTYSYQISRIMNRRCVECHREAEIAPFPLVEYDQVVGWADTIQEVISEGRMPPWFADPKHGDFHNDARMTEEEKQLVYAWIENGCPQGDPAQLPPPPEFTKGWRIPKPDKTFYMREEPFDVPAEGVVDYKYFRVDPGFEEDQYITAAEARPGNHSVVHHIIVFIVPPGAKKIRTGGALIGYAPGMPPLELPKGTAIKVPAGSQLVFEMHYTPIGSKQKDRSYVGFTTTDKKNVENYFDGHAIVNHKFRIPPGAPNHKVTAQRKIPRDVQLLTMTPHMHFRGKSFRYEAVYPNGKKETLLEVPNYDFNWQLRYELEEPKLLPKGTVLRCIAHFDNSENNLANPDPTEEVRWGEQSWEEMMIGFLGTVQPKSKAK